jgi:putative oxidoreductase
MSQIPTLIIGTRRQWRDPIGWLLRILVAVLFVLFSLGKFNSDPHGEWFRIFARIGFGQWFRVATGVIELVGGLLFLLPGAARFAALPLAATMLGAALAQLTVLGHPVWAIIPIALLALVVIVGFRDPSLDDTIATLQQRRADRTSVTATKPRA